MGDQIEEERKKEFRRQQDRIKMMAADSEKRQWSADAMINSLLQKTDTFKKTSSNLPSWLQADSSTTSPYYTQVWQYVKASEAMADTLKISQLLLTSGLHPDVLGFIWNLANTTTPGQLTKQELFVVLALVGLAQAGCAFNNTSVLNLVPNPPIPRLMLPIFSPSTPVVHTSFNPVSSQLSFSSLLSVDTSNSTPSVIQSTSLVASSASTVDDEFDDFQSVPASNDSWSFKNSSTQPNYTIGEDHIEKSIDAPVPSISPSLHNVSQSSITATTADDFSDFADFQSADQFDTNIVQPAKVTLPKLSSFIKVSPESERKLRYLSQPDSLTALPESKISSRNQVSTMPSIAVVGASRSVGSRLANHTLGGKTENGRVPKLTKIKPIVSASVASLPSEEIFPKCVKSSFLLKETKIPSLDVEMDPKEHELTRTFEIPIVGALKETALPVVKKLESKNTPELFSFEADKYGALRDFELSNVTSTLDTNDDFGDFLSAEKTTEAWSSWNNSVCVPDNFIAQNEQIEDMEKDSNQKVTNNNVHNYPEDVSSISFENLNNIVTSEEIVSQRNEVPNFKNEDGKSKLGGGDVEFSTQTRPNCDMEEIIFQAENNLDWSEVTVEDKPDLEMIFVPVKNSDEIADAIPTLKVDRKFPDFSSFSITAETPSTNFDLLGTFSDVKITPHEKKDENLESTTLKPEKLPTNQKIQPNYDVHDFSEVVEEDFGDFVAPAADDSKSVHSSTPSYELGRRDSWSSLDFKTDSGKISRKTSVPSLQGEKSPHSVGVRCMQCCCDLIRDAVAIFNNVEDKAVLKEVFQTIQARNYINCLSVANQIAARICENYSGSITITNEALLLWKQIMTFVTEYSIPLEEPIEGVAAESTWSCAVCRGPITGETAEHKNSKYHVACANLWINCISSSLPCSSGDDGVFDTIM